MFWRSDDSLVGKRIRKLYRRHTASARAAYHDDAHDKNIKKGKRIFQTRIFYRTKSTVGNNHKRFSHESNARAIIIVRGDIRSSSRELCEIAPCRPVTIKIIISNNNRTHREFLFVQLAQKSENLLTSESVLSERATQTMIRTEFEAGSRLEC